MFNQCVCALQVPVPTPSRLKRTIPTPDKREYWEQDSWQDMQIARHVLLTHQAKGRLSVVFPSASPVSLTVCLPSRSAFPSKCCLHFLSCTSCPAVLPCLHVMHFRLSLSPYSAFLIYHVLPFWIFCVPVSALHTIISCSTFLYYFAYVVSPPPCYLSSLFLFILLVFIFPSNPVLCFLAF